MTTCKFLKIDNNTSVEVPTIYDNLPKILDGPFNKSALQWHVASALLKDYISGNISYQSGKKFGTVDENGDYYFSGTREALAKKYHCGVDTLRKVIKKLISTGLLKIGKYLKKIFIVKTGRVSTVNFFHFCLRSTLQKLGLVNDYPTPFKPAQEACEEPQNRTPLESVASHLHDLSSTQYLNKSKKKENFKKNQDSKKPVEQVEEKLSSPLREEKKPQRTLARDSLKIWNEEMNDNQKLTYSLSKFLVGALKTKLNFDLEKWRRYCKMFKDKGYLGINSALAYKTMDRILKEEVNPLAGEPITDSQISSKLEALTEPEAHKEVRRIIAKAIGYPMYYSWFHQAKLVDRNGKIQLIAPNAFVEENWKNRFSWLYLDNDLQKGT